MASLFLTLKNIFHGVVAVFMLIPILATMGDAGDPNTPVETYPDSTNAYITEYLDPDVAAHRSGAGVAPQTPLWHSKILLLTKKQQALIPLNSTFR